MAVETIINSCTVQVPSPATTLIILGGGKHTYANISGNKPWQLSLYYDGALLNYAQGSGYGTDAPSVFGTVTNIPVGSHTFTLGWYGDPSMSIKGVNLIVQQALK